MTTGEITTDEREVCKVLLNGETLAEKPSDFRKSLYDNPNLNEVAAQANVNVFDFRNKIRLLDDTSTIMLRDWLQINR